MSLLSKVFGGGKNKNKAPTPQEAIQKLRETEEMLEKKQAFLEKKIDHEIATAKKNAAKNKRGNKMLSLISCHCLFLEHPPLLHSNTEIHIQLSFSL